ncbi:MAG: alkaline phosphatase [Gammaproteobacteria bacterium]|nr:alkaline phosphatase [Gammaproteobacteria bacterium]
MIRITRPMLPAFAAVALSACATQSASNSSHTAYTPIPVPSIERPAGETADWWFRHGAAAAARASHRARADNGHARNVIVFLGDGMSITTIAAAHILAGQRKGLDGESYRLSFEKFPFTALSRTYETDHQVADSAGTMTAIMTGAKTKMGFIGVGQDAERGNCASRQGHVLVTMLELAKAAGLSAGVVTTTRITHATPAATYGHLPERGWEVDSEMPGKALAAGCTDFAAQLVDFPIGGGIDVAMGGGRTEFLPAGMRDPEYPQLHGRRDDGRDLIVEWKRKNPDGAYVWNADQLAALNLAQTTKLLGLFEPSHMHYDHDRPQDKAGEPGLAQMTRAALKVLEKNPEGFFLLVEGGRIDHALHAGNAFRALDDTIAFAKAVQVALDMTRAEDTLIVVTADHSHTLVFRGYPARGNSILGLVRDADGERATDALGLPYTTLAFGSGPGYTGATDAQPEGPKHFPHHYDQAYGIHHGQPDLTHVDTADPNYLQAATIPKHGETHGGEDVAVFAHGAGAAAFHGEIEENTIFHLIVQQVPALRKELCRLGSCNADGVPVHRPSYKKLTQIEQSIHDEVR